MKNRIILLLLLFLALQGKIGAQIMGSDLGFKSLGNGKYKIILKLYRDCSGDSIPATADSLFWFASDNGVVATLPAYLEMTRVSIKDISLFCKKSQSPCNPQNRPSGTGIEEHTFNATIDLNKSPFISANFGNIFCELTIAYHHCCRNSSITTIPSGQEFWTHSSIDICNLNRCIKKNNSTAEFGNFPVIQSYDSLPVYYNNLAMDTADFDSLSFRQLPGLGGLQNIPIIYNSPFTYQYPLTPVCFSPVINCTPNPNVYPPIGFYFDYKTGNLTFTPAKLNERAIFSQEISEFRNDSTGKKVLIGKSRREMQVFVDSSAKTNHSPQINGPYNNKVCEGDKICFTIYTSDIDKKDTVSLYWNLGISNGTWTILNPKDREKQAQFCWQTKVGNSSEVAYAFTVAATDDHCPTQAKSIVGFKVKVNQRAFAQRRLHILKDGRLAMEALISPTFKGTYSIKWSLRDSNGNNEFFYSTKRTDTTNVANRGDKIIVVSAINNAENCPTLYRDTVYTWNLLNGVNNFQNPLNLFPNPAHAGDEINLNKSKGKYQLWSLSGQLMGEGMLHNNYIAIPKNIAAGMYWISVIDKDKISRASVFILSEE